MSAQMLFTDAMHIDGAEAEDEGMLEAAVPSLHLHLDTETQSLLCPFPPGTDDPPPEQPPAEVCCPHLNLHSFMSL